MIRLRRSPAWYWSLVKLLLVVLVVVGFLLASYEDSGNPECDSVRECETYEPPEGEGIP